MKLFRRIRPGVLYTAVLVFCLVLLLSLTAVVIVIQNRAAEEAARVEEEEYRDWLRGEEEKRARLAWENSLDFAGKLKNGVNTRVLVIGDSIALGSNTAAYADRWHARLDSKLEAQYGGLLDVENIAMAGGSAFTGWARILSGEAGEDCDAAVVMLGLSDGATDFALYYESLLRALRRTYPRSTVYTVIEPGTNPYLSEEERLAQTVSIRSLSEYYQTTLLDMADVFDAHPQSDTLYKDPSKPVHLSPAGEELVAATLSDVIAGQVRAWEVPAADYVMPAPQNADALALDRCRYLSAAAFTRTAGEGKTLTLTLLSSLSPRLFGVDYIMQPGENSILLTVDGTPVLKEEDTVSWRMTFRSAAAQRYVFPVARGDTLPSGTHIEITFETATVAVRFRGLIVCEQP